MSRNFGTEQNFDTQQARVAQLKATVAADEALIETAQTQLDYTTIRAPSDGRIGIRLLDAGNFVRVADPGSEVVCAVCRSMVVAMSITPF